MPPHSEIHDGLALAIVASSNTPLLLLDDDLQIICISETFLQGFQIQPASVGNCELSQLGRGEWASAQLTGPLRATVTGHAAINSFEMNLRRAGQADRLLVINARHLAYGDRQQGCLLVSVLDVTDARTAENLKDDLLRDKAILLSEMQHRVANSLQIIAGVLMRKALEVRSDETRGHLYEINNRVLSVAAIQEQLSPSEAGDIELRGYFTALCDSIGVSMIRDAERVSLSVKSDDSVVSADISVCLGLIITELVINALKHAFPGDCKGEIAVRYKSKGNSWKLSVIDNGIGMPKDVDEAGLGTMIVEALAKKLGARLNIASSEIGLSVSIIHP